MFLSALLFILKLLGFILLGLFVLFTALLFVPFEITARYAERSLTVSAGAFGIKIRVYPFPERKERKESGKEEPKEPKEEKPKQKPAPPDLEKILSIIELAKKPLAHILRGISLTHVVVSVVTESEEPDIAGRDAGMLWAVFGALDSFVTENKNIEIERLEAIPNFMHTDISSVYSGTLTARPVTMLAAGFMFLRAWLKYKAKEKTTEIESKTKEVA